MTTLRRSGWLWLLILLTGGCVAQPAPSPRAKGRLSSPPTHKTEAGLRFTLEPGEEKAAGQQSLKRPPLSPLSQAEVEALLKRLPAMAVRPGDRQDFALRPGSLPPPRTAKTLVQPFPPPPGPEPKAPDLASTPLEVVQISPQGEVQMAPHLSVTFNQPMVPLTSLDELKEKEVPVKLTPPTPGKWRWVGTQVLMFVPNIRLPMATRFEVEVPAGVASANGNKLKELRKESFQTPPLTLDMSFPGSGEPQALQPTIFLRFNQAIDRQQVLSKLKFTGGENPPALRLASAAEILEEERLPAYTQGVDEKRWLALRPSQPLKPGQGYTVEVPVGTPSAEGPLLTTQSQAFSFATYDPLKIVWNTDRSRPGQGWSVNFNNPLDAEKFDPSWVTVTPQLPGQQIQVSGHSLYIRGRSKGRSQYQVRLSDSICDTFKQKLSGTQQFKVEVGPAEPAFRGPSQAFLVLDPEGKRELVCDVINHRQLQVEAWKVTPEDWGGFLRFLQTFRQDLKDAPSAPGRKVIDRVVQVKAPEDEETEVGIDLSEALEDGLGQVLVKVEALPRPKNHWERRYYIGWVQSTRLGLDAVSDSGQLKVWTNDLASGRSVVAAEVQLGQARARSDQEGMASLPLPPSYHEHQLLIARKGKDLAILPRSFSYWSAASWSTSSPSDSTLWHVLDDRQLYKPGEKVSVKGWVRRHQYGPKGDLVLDGMQSVNYTLYDSQGNEVSKGQATVGKLGGFHFEVALPKNINLGPTRLQLSGNTGSSHSHSFQVEEFRRPEFEVSAEANPGSSMIGSNSILTASASYFAGGPLANAKVTWNASATPTHYSPPGWDGYTFGTWTPWWEYRCWWMPESMPSSNSTTRESTTDSKGKSVMKADFLSVDPPRPHSLSAQATVQDVNRQTWTSSTQVLVHPASVYVGLRSQRTFVEQGKPLELSVVVTDLDGKPVTGRQVELTSYRLDWDAVGKTVHADEKKQVLTSSSDPLTVKILAAEGGTYQIEARVFDSENRLNSSQLTTWVAGGKVPPTRGVEQEQIGLVPDKKEYQPGEVAEVLVQAPFAPAELLVTTRRNGLASLERIQAPQGSATLKVPLHEYQIPGLNLQVDAVGSKQREDGRTRRPAYASGTLTLNLSTAQRQLAVKVQPARSKAEPGSKTQLDVELKDYQGNPVQGEVTLIMVDEAVLALTGYNPADPLPAFTQLRSSDCEDTHLRQYLRLSRMPEGELAEPQEESTRDELAPPAPSGMVMSEMEGGAVMSKEVGGPPARSAARARSQAPADKKKSAPSSTIKVRTNFTPLALFVPSLNTDARGRASSPVQLPDNLTRYRIIALANAGTKQFGKGESSLVARQPLMLRPSPPRFLNFGDRCELPCVIQNQSDSAMQVQIACRASQARLGQGGSQWGYRLQVPANDRVEVRFPCSTEEAGQARFQFAAAAPGASDAAEVSFPVWTPATTEAFATYGILDEGAARQPLEKPKDVWPQFGGLSITTSSTALAELTDAFLYLTSYPFDCSEQVASRILAAAALKDVLQAFQAPGMASKEELQAAMARDLERLRVLQSDDGGWDYWVRNKPSVPFLSIHVTHALVRCKEKGFEVREEMLESALEYLAHIESHIPADYSAACRRSIRAYALYTLQLAGQPQPEKARKLAKEIKLEDQEMETLGWLLPTLHKDPASQATTSEILRLLNNRSTQTASTAQFSSTYSDQGYLVLHSSRRVDGLLLEALIATRPDHPLIPKLVRGLLNHRKAGRWSNTQENCWVLLALDRYFQQYEKVTPDFVARIWLGNAFAGEQKFKGRNKDELLLEVPMSQVQGPVTLSKEGPGRLYYRLGLRYAPKDLKQAPADYGFGVQRVYEAVDDNRDVEKTADGSWRIKAGARVKVTLTMHAPSRRYHVALVDPLPAGLEALNPALKGSQLPESSGRARWWNWYDHENLRDERVEAFTQLLWEGVYTYSYYARATTPGDFVVPPAKAEEMYAPETFGRSASDRVEVVSP